MRTRPVMRYHGGKFLLADWIISHFPPHHIYEEWFGGAGSVLMKKTPSYSEIYNDLDDEICNVFRVLRNPASAEKLKHACNLTPYARREFDLSYIPCNEPIEQARRTLFRSFAGHGSAAASGYNTGFRANATRSHTTPTHDWARWNQHIETFTTRLRFVTIENRTWQQLAKKNDRQDALKYIDPPYLPETRNTVTRGGKNRCYRHEMTVEDHIELLTELNRSAAMIVLSGYNSELYNDMLPDWTRSVKHTSGDGRSSRTEILWLNPLCVERKHEADADRERIKKMRESQRPRTLLDSLEAI